MRVYSLVPWNELQPYVWTKRTVFQHEWQHFVLIAKNLGIDSSCCDSQLKGMDGSYNHNFGLRLTAGATWLMPQVGRTG